MKSKGGLWLLAGLVLAAVLIGVLTAPRRDAGAVDVSPEELRAGREYLARQAEKDPAAVDAGLKQRDAEQRARARAELLEKLCQDEAGIWSRFNNYVLMGEALSTGFSVYGYLSEERVLADNNATINSIPKRLTAAAAKRPEVVFLCYGINDLNSGNWPTPDSYAQDLMEMAALVREKIPGARLVVSSILPVQEKAVNRNAYWARIPEYNAALEAACAKNRIEFADVSRLAAEHSDLWESDGIHLRPGFYRYWACCLIACVEEPAYED